MCLYPTSSIQDIASRRFTYIVVGGGTAGCVLASRLSEDPQVTVLLVERGPVVEGWLSSVPLLSSNITTRKAPLYKWQSVPIAPANNKTLTMIGGKALGGSSKINGLVYSRSVPGEYNAWAAAGRRHWDWQHVEPFFNRSESYMNSVSFRGHAGPWQIQNMNKTQFQTITSNMLTTSRRGIPYIPQSNDPSSSVATCAHLDATIDRSGRRNSTLDAFLPRRLAETRTNLYVCTKTIVLSLKFQGQQVVGVALEPENEARNTQGVVAYAEREVVLCAGAIFSPQILLLSGIGPGDHLVQRGVPIVKDLPGVGAHLQDHVSVPIVYKVPVDDSLEVLITRPWVALTEMLKYCLTGKGLFGIIPQQANIVLRSALLDDSSHLVITDAHEELNGSDPANIPDIEITLIPENASHRQFDNLGKSNGTFSYLCTILRPQSTGSIRLASQDARRPPLCELGLLSDVNDREPLRRALRLALAQCRAVRMGGYPLEDLLVPVTESDTDLDAFTNENLATPFDYSSSCRMADEANLGVVDDELRVHGVSGLRIADASVLPQVPACHLQAPVVMIAERCAQFLKNAT